MLNNFAASNIEISVGSQELFKVAGFPVTNSMLTGLLGIVVMFAVFAYVVSMLKRGKYNRFVGLVQWAFEGMLGQVYDVIPDAKLARKVAPLALSIFFIMLFSYWMSVLPGLESITYNRVPILRSLAADLNFTFAVAIIVLITVGSSAFPGGAIWATAGSAAVASLLLFIASPRISSFVLGLVGKLPGPFPRVAEKVTVALTPLRAITTPYPRPVSPAGLCGRDLPWPDRESASLPDRSTPARHSPCRSDSQQQFLDY